MAQGHEHRPWPPPARPPVMRQTWHDLLFAHWPLPAEEVRRVVPAQLQLDTFDGRAWMGVIPFRMTGVRFAGWPAIPGTSAFEELNVRTYVTHQDKPGVWFFSLDAASRLAVWAARAWYRLPYFHARMSCARQGEAIRYTSVRRESGAPEAKFAARYRSAGKAFRAAPGSLDHWLTERYSLYALARGGRLLRAEIHHAPWPLQPAEAEIESNTMAEAAGLRLPEAPPRLHFALRLDVAVGRPSFAVREDSPERC